MNCNVCRVSTNWQTLVCSMQINNCWSLWNQFSPYSIHHTSNSRNTIKRISLRNRRKISQFLASLFSSTKLLFYNMPHCHMPYISIQKIFSLQNARSIWIPNGQMKIGVFFAKIIPWMRTWMLACFCMHNTLWIQIRCKYIKNICNFCLEVTKAQFMFRSQSNAFDVR